MNKLSQAEANVFASIARFPAMNIKTYKTLGWILVKEHGLTPEEAIKVLEGRA